MRVKLLILLFFLIIFSIKFYSLEKEIIKDNLYNNYTTNGFNYLFDRYENIKSNDNIKLFTFWDGNSTTDLYRTGLNLFIFGIASGIIGSSFIAIGFVFTWLLSGRIGWTFANTLTNLLVSYSSFGSFSYFASLAICCWVLGAILCVLLLLFIPGVILMAIGHTRISKIINPAEDAIGVTFKL